MTAPEIDRAIRLTTSEIDELNEADRKQVENIRELHRQFWGKGHCVHRDCTVCAHNPIDTP